MTTVQMDPQTAAFYKGVAVGTEVLQLMLEQHHDFDQLVIGYWLYVGMNKPTDLAEANVASYVAGATTRAPSRSDVFLLEIRTAGAAFMGPESDGEVDDETAVHEVSRILRKYALMLDGFSVGDKINLLDVNGNTVGCAEFH